MYYAYFWIGKSMRMMARNDSTARERMNEDFYLICDTIQEHFTIAITVASPSSRSCCCLVLLPFYLLKMYVVLLYGLVDVFIPSGLSEWTNDLKSKRVIPIYANGMLNN